MSDKLTVTGLTPLELRELEDALGDASVEELGQIPPDANFPEPTVMIIAGIVLTELALRTLAMIALRPRKSGTREIVIERTDGQQKLTIWFKESQSESGAPSQPTIEAIGKALNVDLKALAEAADGNG